MKIKLCIGIFLLAVTWLRAQTNDLTALLQQGLFEEQANRNLDAAIADYQSLAAEFDKNRQLAATAVFRLGECYRAQGRTNEAAAQYQRIIHDFSDQQTLVTLSRQDLAGMGVASSDAGKTTVAAGPSNSFQASAETGSLAAQISGIEKLKSDPEEQARATLAIFPDEDLKTMLLHLPKLQEQEARLKANPQLTITDLLGYHATSITFAVGPDEVPFGIERMRNSKADSTNLLAAAELQLATQITWIQERVNFIVGIQRARLKALQAAGSDAGPEVVQSEAAHSVADDEDREIARIQQMIQNSPDLINAPSDGSTPLAVAAYHGWLKVAAYLLGHGADVNIVSPDIRWNKELTDAGQLSPLAVAVLTGNKAMTQFLIERGADINFKTLRGYLNGRIGDTPLHLAAQQGFQSVTEVLLASHAEVNIPDSDGLTPLDYAVQNGHHEIVQMLLAAGADANLKDNQGRTVLNYAIGVSPEIFQTLLDAGANPNTEDSAGRTPLSYAVEKDSPQIVKLLLSAKADPNGGKLDTPLVVAINKKDVASAELLLRAGANPNANELVGWQIKIASNWYSNGRQLTPLFLTVSMGQLPMVQLLLKYKADPNDSQTDGQSLLFSTLRDTNIFAALLEAGANAGAARPDGWTLLDSAVSEKNSTAVQLLLKYKADPNASQIDKRSLLFNALSDTNMLEALLDAGAKVDPITLDEANWTPLDNAARETNAAAVEILLKHGANPNVRNSNGATPLHWAAYAPQPQLRIFELLLAYKADPNVRSSNRRTPLDELKAKLESPDFMPELKPANALVAGWLRQHGALDRLPDWDCITMSRPAANFSFAIFHQETNDWNQFTLLEALANFFNSSQSYWVPQGNSSSAGYSLPSMLPFPDLTRVVIVRPSRDSTNETRITVNLLDQKNGIDCSNDVPLEFGDVVEVPERDHSLGDSETGPTDGQRETLVNYVKGAVRLKVQDQQVDIPFYRLENAASLEAILTTPEARKLLLASSDLAHVKVIRHNLKNGERHEWIFDCSNLGGGNAAPGRPLSYQRNYNGGSPEFTTTTITSSALPHSFWLRDGDVIEVPEKP